jgi:hypothetical protein
MRLQWPMGVGQFAIRVASIFQFFFSLFLKCSFSK